MPPPHQRKTQGLGWPDMGRYLAHSLGHSLAPLFSNDMPRAKEHTKEQPKECAQEWSSWPKQTL